jgi:prepilin-type N-terminal cleavage/methylation domain-containing protein
MTKKTSSAFTLIEMLVVIAIIATIAAFAVPALTSALQKGQMTGVMNNARQFYLAGYQMALDGSTNSDGNLAWPGDYSNPSVDTLQDYCSKLVGNDYLKAGDLAKVLSAPGAACTATATTANNVTTVTLAGKSGLKIYKVTEADPSDAIFAVTANYTYNTALDNTKSPFGDKGFVVVHKGGDALSLRKNNATEANYGSVSKFEAAVGKLTGDAEGTVTSGDGTGKVLTNP